MIKMLMYGFLLGISVLIIFPATENNPPFFETIIFLCLTASAVLLSGPMKKSLYNYFTNANLTIPFITSGMAGFSENALKKF